MSELFILIIEDRHTGVDAYPYSTEELANEALDDWLEQSVRHPEDVEENETSGDCLRSVAYSCEGDHVSIVRRTVDAD